MARNVEWVILMRLTEAEFLWPVLENLHLVVEPNDCPALSPAVTPLEQTKITFQTLLGNTANVILPAPDMATSPLSPDRQSAYSASLAYYGNIKAASQENKPIVVLMGTAEGLHCGCGVYLPDSDEWIFVAPTSANDSPPPPLFNMFHQTMIGMTNDGQRIPSPSLYPNSAIHYLTNIEGFTANDPNDNMVWAAAAALLLVRTKTSDVINTLRANSPHRYFQLECLKSCFSLTVRDKTGNEEWSQIYFDLLDDEQLGLCTIIRKLDTLIWCQKNVQVTDQTPLSELKKVYETEKIKIFESADNRDLLLAYFQLWDTPSIKRWIALALSNPQVLTEYLTQQKDQFSKRVNTWEKKLNRSWSQHVWHRAKQGWELFSTITYVNLGSLLGHFTLSRFFRGLSHLPGVGTSARFIRRQVATVTRQTAVNELGPNEIAQVVGGLAGLTVFCYACLKDGDPTNALGLILPMMSVYFTHGPVPAEFDNAQAIVTKKPITDLGDTTTHLTSNFASHLAISACTQNPTPMILFTGGTTVGLFMRWLGGKCMKPATNGDEALDNQAKLFGLYFLGNLIGREACYFAAYQFHLSNIHNLLHEHLVKMDFIQEAGITELQPIEVGLVEYYLTRSARFNFSSTLRMENVVSTARTTATVRLSHFFAPEVFIDRSFPWNVRWDPPQI